MPLTHFPQVEAIQDILLISQQKMQQLLPLDPYRGCLNSNAPFVLRWSFPEALQGKVGINLASLLPVWFTAYGAHLPDVLKSPRDIYIYIGTDFSVVFFSGSSQVVGCLKGKQASNKLFTSKYSVIGTNKLLA